MAIETWKPLETDGEGWRRMEEVGSAGRREGKGEMSKDENDSRNGIKRNTKERQRNVKYEINSRVAKHGNSPRIEPQFLIPAGWDIGIRRTKLTQMSTPSSGQFWRRLTRRPCPYERAALFGDGANYKSKILAQYIQIGARKNKDPLFSSSFSTFFLFLFFFNSSGTGKRKQNFIQIQGRSNSFRFVSATAETHSNRGDGREENHNKINSVRQNRSGDNDDDNNNNINYSNDDDDVMMKSGNQKRGRVNDVSEGGRGGQRRGEEGEERRWMISSMFHFISAWKVNIISLSFTYLLHFSPPPSSPSTFFNCWAANSFFISLSKLHWFNHRFARNSDPSPRCLVLYHRNAQSN